MTQSCRFRKRELIVNISTKEKPLHHIEGSYRAPQVRRSGRDRGQFPMLDQIEGRDVPLAVKEPDLIRQKPPQPKPGRQNADPGKVMVRCRQIIKGGRPQTVPLTDARGKFKSFQAKCQSCINRPQCTTD